MKKKNAQNETKAPYHIGIVCIILLVGCYFASLHIFKGVELDRASAKLALYEATIDDELSRLSHLPMVLADKELVRMVARGEQGNALNRKLKSISDAARAEAIYLMNKKGLTIASSNFDAPKTFLGQNYGFRPYFLNSMNGQSSTFFAIGATTSRPGFFLSSPVKNDETVIGVLAIKLDLTALNERLQSTGDLIMVSNSDQIILLSSNPEWRYKSLAPLSQERLDEIALERQFGREKLTLLKWQKDRDHTAKLGDTAYIEANKKIYNDNWTLTYLQPSKVLHERAILAAAALLLLMGGITMILTYMRSKRLRQTLEASQRSRAKLQREISVRKVAEYNLREAQQELERTSKMVALGQLAASVTHELGQPISAIKNHVAAEEINRSVPQKFLNNLTGIIQRMEHITKQLRFFATGTDEIQDQVLLNQVMADAVRLMKHTLDKDNVEMITSGSTKKLFVSGSHQRLEQVVINLLQNALKAMSDVRVKKITLQLTQKDDHAVLRIIDTGHGLKGQSLETLTEPFHTTGRSGEGMGLGLAISASIIAEHSGSIKAGDNKDCGAWFDICLPLIKVEKTTENKTTEMA